MPTNKEILSVLDEHTLSSIEDLAAGNFAPSDIAVRLSINKAGFMRIWREEGSEIRTAYEKGRLRIKEMKMQALETEVELGNITAIQIHDKHSEELDFEAKKKEIFGLE